MCKCKELPVFKCYSFNLLPKSSNPIKKKKNQTNKKKKKKKKKTKQTDSREFKFLRFLEIAKCCDDRPRCVSGPLHTKCTYIVFGVSNIIFSRTIVAMELQFDHDQYSFATLKRTFILEGLQLLYFITEQQGYVPYETPIIA